MYLAFLSVLALSCGAVLSDPATIEIVNAGEETLLVRMKTLDLFVLLPPGDTYVVTEYGNHFQDDIWAFPAKCVNEPCDYQGTYAQILILPLNDNVTATRSSYDFVEGPYNRPMTIESLDQPDCPVASCEFDLVTECPENSQVKNDEGTVVACFIAIGDIEIFESLCPEATDHLSNLSGFAFICQASRALRVSIR